MSTKLIKKKPIPNDLSVFCLLCKIDFKVKYSVWRKRYHLYNNWGYLIDKKEQENEWICNSCLLKFHYGNINDWIENKKKAAWFYVNVSRGKYRDNEY